MSNRELLGDKHYLMMLKDEQDIRQRRNAFKGRPDPYERVQIELDRMFLRFYSKVL